MFTAVKFAEEMKISYPTIVRWLRLGIVPGARKEATLVGDIWQIPESALGMESPFKPGPKKGSKRTVVDVEAKPAKKPRKKGEQ